jgi:eukaryotic-like serine/threonine-protein kinase
MPSQHWDQIEQVFHEALQREPAEREAFVLKQCADDQNVRDEVMTLIECYEEEADFLEKSQLTRGFGILAGYDTELSQDDSVGPYVIEHKIGSGGMGDVYRARDQRLGRLVALKFLPHSFEKDPVWISRLQNEARSSSIISHPNVAHIYEVGVFEDRHYIAMEYIDGVTLRSRLKQSGRLDLSEALDIVTQITRALIGAHAVGILHRDIKPDNVMIDRNGYVKVLDFGLAKLAHVVNEPRVSELPDNAVDTAPGLIMGSPAYMSPEQARGGQLDARTDLWSLGVVFYELLSNRNPFLKDDTKDTIAAITDSSPPPLSSYCPDLPAEIESLVNKLLSRSPGDRFQSAQSLLASLTVAAEQIKTHHQEEQATKSGNTTSETLRRHTAPLSSVDNTTIRFRPRFLQQAIAHPTIPVAVVSAIVVTLLLVLKAGNDRPSTISPLPIRSLAVLPLVNESGDQNGDYVSDGLSEGLIERFSRLAQLNVIARNSSFKYKGKAPKDVAKELGVQALVVGTIVKDRDDMQIKVDLVDESGTNQLWSGRYHNKTSNLPLLLNDVARQIAGRLNLNLTDEELNLVARDQNVAGNAYERYLKGRSYWNQLTEEGLDKSIECFNEALAIDPKFALAYTGLANSYNTLGAAYRSSAEVFGKAELNAQKGLALDGNLAEAHYAIAVTRYVYKWDLSGAENEAKRSLELNPNYAIAYSLLSSISLSRGDLNQATTHINRALKLDPLSLLFNSRLSYIYYCQRDTEKQLKLIQNFLNREPSASLFYNDMAMAYAQTGKFDDAMAASQRAMAVIGQDPDTLSTLGVVNGLAGKTKDAKWVAETLEQLAKKRYVPPYLIARVYSALDDKNRALLYLGKAVEQHDSYLLRVKVEWIFERLRSDPRFDKILQSINLK